MAHSENNTLSSAFKTFFERETLTGPNFNELTAFKAEYKKHSDVACIMLGNKSLLYKAVENIHQNMLAELRKMFEKPPAVEIYDLVDALHSYRQAPGKPVSEHVLEMKGLMAIYIHWENHTTWIIAVNLINRSLNKDLGDFVETSICIAWGKTVTELHACSLLRKGFEKDNSTTPQDLKKKGNYLMGINICKWAMEHKQLLKPYECVVSLSCLLDLGFHHTIASNGISVSLNGIFYFSAISVNGVFEIDINNNVPKNNNNSIFSINKKRKLDLDSSYLWHCRLAHIGKTRMQKLHREGLLENIDEESFDKCESCISGKMTKKPFNKNIERATDLLGLIHTDVCGPLRHVSRKGASYFLTFTDDFSRYGYVYLLKHKHEVFETFKVFKAEVELQLGKKIKALRSDRGGEYLSQEFKDYLSENGIVQNLTSPYTPQQNGDYALESAVRILNMVPTKKVDKTPYEIWHGKAPNLDIGEHANYKAAMLDPDKVIWQGAMDEEMNSMKVNEV
ncbi:retrotransposon protein, putative, ty1-copia subclass [Tanacetum coccineum]